MINYKHDIISTDLGMYTGMNNPNFHSESL